MIDVDEDGVLAEDDCDDTNPTVGELATDADCDGAVAEEDCNDEDAAIHPGAQEICDGIDNDCDEAIDSADDSIVDATLYYADLDGDGFGNADAALLSCEPPSGHVLNGTDCNDDDPTFYPGAPEEDCADPNDYNCDGSVGYADADADGFAACTECDDENSSIHPDAEEVCDEIDNDCNGEVDQGAIDSLTWYADTDSDGYGDPNTTISACEQPTGYLPNSSDCDDGNPTAHPGGLEVCDGADNDCNGTIDDGALDAVEWYADSDGDGYGHPDHITSACEPPSGYISDNTDCEDSLASVNPAATEVCDGIDNDCDGDSDEDDAADAGTWYGDADGDGWGGSQFVSISCDAPSGYVSDSDDCNDTDAATYPGAPEICDEADNDCDGTVDEQVELTWYADGDGDGYGNSSQTTLACSQPPGHSSNADDCDDTAPGAHPGGLEICDGLDNDCDGTVDEPGLDASTWYADTDTDGYGDAANTTPACTQPSGYTSDDSDCNDGDPAVNPAATEACDGADNDCDGTIDENTAADASTWYADADSDGFGNAIYTTTACSQPSGYAPVADDCNDTDISVHPGANESCDGIDNDCDGDTDEADSIGAPTWYADSDADGFGDPNVTSQSCAAASGYVNNSSDCNDADAAINPSAAELCDGIDNNCDTSIDNAAVDGTNYYADTDSDGYGDATASQWACSTPSGHVSDTTDCDDTSATVNPGATETCNSVDDNCDGTIDENSASDASTWYADTDSDGYGDPNTSAVSCSAASGYISDGADCNDTEPNIHSGATEVCDAIDNNCDGTVDENTAADASTWYADSDLDGYGDANNSSQACSQPSGAVSDATDCDDTNIDINPIATEYCNSVDDNCDGTVDEDTAADASTWYADNDSDGYGEVNSTSLACSQPSGFVADNTDCDDTDGSVFPGSGCSTCGDGVLDFGEEYDPPPGPFSNVSVDSNTCRWDFSDVKQLYCNGSCSWGGGHSCDQADADILCKLITDNANSTATSWSAITAQAEPGFPCTPLGYGTTINTNRVSANVSWQDSSILANHGAGAIIYDPTCTNP